MGHLETAFREIKTIEQAQSYILELVQHVEESRHLCDLTVTVEAQKLAFQRYNVKYGQALGALTTLCHTRTINDVAYANLRDRVLATRQATVVPGIIRA